jgi:hypothetical protein
VRCMRSAARTKLRVDAISRKVCARLISIMAAEFLH